MGISIIVCTHGKTAEQMVNSVEMIMGKQNNIKAVNFISGEGTEDIKKKYLDTISKMDNNDGVLFLVDLFGGSPFNVASTLAIENKNYEVITGVNIPMIIQVLISRESNSLNEIIKVALDNGKNGITHFNKQVVADEEESF